MKRPNPSKVKQLTRAINKFVSSLQAMTNDEYTYLEIVVALKESESHWATKMESFGELEDE